MNRIRFCCVLLASIVVIAACNDSPTQQREPATASVTGTLPSDPAAGATLSASVLVHDADGQPVSGVAVTFQVTAGGGSVSGSTATTNGAGIATRSWTLGPQPGVNTIVATAGSLAPLSISVTSCDVFCIVIRYVGSVSIAHRTAFTNAKLRWQEVITGDLSQVALNAQAGECKDDRGVAIVDHPAINETIDDLLVYVEIESIDGPGQVLGSAGPCYIRNSNQLPVLGIMRLDRDDLELMEAGGSLGDVILHELGHVLGFPAVWKLEQFQLLQDTLTNNPYFSGQHAASSFTLAGGTLVNGVGVPVETAGGAGTRLAHWRESVFASELMSGFVSGGNNPLSAITIGSLRDIGYQVDMGAADPYTLPGSGAAAGSGSLRVELIERPMPPPRVVN
jgi:hypothetical protein